MIVVPESMMVLKPVTAAVLPTYAEAPVSCQKPSEEESTSWYSSEPE